MRGGKGGSVTGVDNRHTTCCPTEREIEDRHSYRFSTSLPPLTPTLCVTGLRVATQTTQKGTSRRKEGEFWCPTVVPKRRKSGSCAVVKDTQGLSVKGRDIKQRNNLRGV